MKQDEEKYGRKGGVQDEKSQGRKRITSHPPIIIVDDDLDTEALAAGERSGGDELRGNDMIVRFDSVHDAHYRDEPPMTFRSTMLTRIDRVEAIDEDNNSHVCLNTPSHCRIEVLGKKNGNTDEKITVRANGQITIVFDRAKYSPEASTGNRRKHRGALRKIKGMKIFNSAGTEIHDCEIARNGKDVRILICDEGCIPLP
jgi:hypothetical protein